MTVYAVYHWIWIIAGSVWIVALAQGRFQRRSTQREWLRIVDKAVRDVPTPAAHQCRHRWLHVENLDGVYVAKLCTTCLTHTINPTYVQWGVDGYE